MGGEGVDTWLVFPNPNNGTFYIQNNTGKNLDLVSLEIFNAIGQRVYANTNIEIGKSTRYRLKTENLNSGIYILRIKDRMQEQGLKVFIQGNDFD